MRIGQRDQGGGLVRRRLLRQLGAVLGIGVVGTSLRIVPRRAVAEEGPLWLCTYNECDPYIYDPLKGDPENINGTAPISPGTAFDDLPDSWICPACGSPKDWFIPVPRSRA